MKTDTAHRLPSLPGRPRLLRAQLLSLLAIPGLLFTSTVLHAVDDNSIPGYINYRGRVLNSSGGLVGETTPVNRKITFKIWATPSGIADTDLVYAEEQTVAILNGDFTALVGQGTRLTGTAGGTAAGGTNSVLALSNSFNHSVRYLGVTVDDGTAAVDTEITPRQQIVSSAFAFRSKFCETASNVLQTDTANPATFAKATISDGSFTGNGAGLTSINAANITSGTLSTTRLPVISDSLISGMSASKLIGQVSDSQISSINASKIGGQIVSSQIQSLDASKLTNTAALPQPSSIGALEIRSGQPYIDFTSDGTGVDYNCRLIASAGSRLDYHAGLHVFNGNVELLNGLHSYNGGAFDGSLSAGQNISAGGSINTSGSFQSGDTQGFYLGNTSHGIKRNYSAGNDVGLYTTSGDVYISGNGAGTTNHMVVKNDGKVGIGTSTPTVQLDVSGSTTITMTDNGYSGAPNNVFGFYVAPATNNTNGTGYGIELYRMLGVGDLPLLANLQAPVSIRATGWIASGNGIVVYSDQRIKRDVATSVPANDLADILKLRVVDYRMVDPANGGAAWRKGFIAQEVEKIIPGAVTRSVEFIPEIFSVATTTKFDPVAKTLVVTLPKDHELKAGDRVRLHMDGTRTDLDVSSVLSARQFTVEKCDHAPKTVLVYGKQVADFRTVNYDRLFTTAIGALQQIKKEKDAEVKALQDENTALRERVAALEAADKTRDAKLAAIEKLLSGAKPAIRTAALKQSN